jgi:SPP1 family predicted phage head-tail adaptor
MQAGNLRKRITVQSRSAATDTFGAQLEQWTDVIDLWADISPGAGRETFSAGAVQEQVSHVITIRWPGPAVSITPSCRVKYGVRVFNVEYVSNVDERNRTLTLGAVELLNQG